MAWVAGIDGCPGGWLAVVMPHGAPKLAVVRHLQRFCEVLDLPEAPAVIAVDMPIGLPERTSQGGRDADIRARRVLGGRQSSVFAVPSRAAVMCGDYAEACAIAFATSDPPRKVSKQAFNIFAKIREIDALMTPELQERVFEVHPEVAFWALNGQRPLDTPKKVKSQSNPPGLAQRMDLLETVGFARAFLEAKHLPRRIAGPDDLIDAAVNAHAAGRILDGTAVRFPEMPQRDNRGLRIEIWG